MDAASANSTLRKSTFMEFLRFHTLEIVFGLIAVIILQFILLRGLSLRLAWLYKTLRALLSESKSDITEKIRVSLEENELVRQRSEKLEAQVQAMQDMFDGCMQSYAMVRYNAYGDVSGEQSFSVALLDGNKNGIVITALYGRHDTRCFGKSIQNGIPVHTLSKEENDALAAALTHKSPEEIGRNPETKTERRKLLKSTSKDKNK